MSDTLNRTATSSLWAFMTAGINTPPVLAIRNVTLTGDDFGGVASMILNIVAPRDTNATGLPDAWEHHYGVSDPNMEFYGDEQTKDAGRGSVICHRSHA